MAKGTFKTLASFNVNSANIINYARQFCITNGHTYDVGIDAVLSGIINNPGISPSISTKTDDINDYLDKWLKRYFDGKGNCASIRTSNNLGTLHDEAIDKIILARMPALSKEDLGKIKYAHRLAMSAENISGSLLEEYLAKELGKYGWYCCWGETAKSIDFIHVNGDLLQIKNSDNSENSSSKAVRNGTSILKWFRRFSKNSSTNWEKINIMMNITDGGAKLSETAYLKFIEDTIKANPNCLAIESESTWGIPLVTLKK